MFALVLHEFHPMESMQVVSSESGCWYQSNLWKDVLSSERIERDVHPKIDPFYALVHRHEVPKYEHDSGRISLLYTLRKKGTRRDSLRVKHTWLVFSMAFLSPTSFQRSVNGFLSKKRPPHSRTIYADDQKIVCEKYWRQHEFHLELLCVQEDHSYLNNGTSDSHLFRLGAFSIQLLYNTVKKSGLYIKCCCV